MPTRYDYLAFFASIAVAADRVVIIPLFGNESAICTGTLVGTRWCDQGDGTVLDMTTGLVWLKKADWGGLKSIRNIRPDCSYPNGECYDDANTRAGMLGPGSAGANLSDGSVAGDWRLPTKNELYNLANGPEAVRWDNMRAFTGVVSNCYWSSSTQVGVTAYAWYIVMNSGNAVANSKGAHCWVLPVRAGN